MAGRLFLLWWCAFGRCVGVSGHFFGIYHSGADTQLWRKWHCSSHILFAASKYYITACLFFYDMACPLLFIGAKKGTVWQGCFKKRNTEKMDRIRHIIFGLCCIDCSGVPCGAVCIQWAVKLDITFLYIKFSIK